MIEARFAKFGPPEVTHANDNAAVRRATKRERQREREMRAHYLEGLSSYGGRAMLWDLIERCETFGSGLVRDPHERDFLAGQRHVGVTLLNDLAALAPALYLQMEDEARKRTALDAESRAAYHTARRAGTDDDEAGAAERAGEETDDE